MYTEHFGFTEKPFKLKPDSRFFYPSEAQKNVVDALLEAIEKRHPLITLTGPAGSGKTTLIGQALPQLNPFARVIQISNTTLPLADLIDQIGQKMELNTAGQSFGDKIQALQMALRSAQQQGKLTLLVIDDAHNLDSAVLQDLLGLARVADATGAPGKPLFMMLAAGLPEVRERLEKHAGASHHSLPALRQDEILAYVTHQLKTAGHARADLFTPNGFEAIIELTRGNPRTVNSLCDAALFIAAMEGQQFVTPEIIDKAAQQCFLKEPERVNYFETQPDANSAEQTLQTPLQRQDVTSLSEQAARQALGLRFGDASRELVESGLPDDSEQTLVDYEDELAETRINTQLSPGDLADLDDELIDAEATQAFSLGQTDLDQTREFRPPSEPPTIVADPGRTATPAPVVPRVVPRAPVKPRRQKSRWPGLLLQLIIIVLLAAAALLVFKPQWLGLSSEQLNGYIERLRDQLTPSNLAPETTTPATSASTGASDATSSQAVTPVPATPPSPTPSPTPEATPEPSAAALAPAPETATATPPSSTSSTDSSATPSSAASAVTATTTSANTDTMTNTDSAAATSAALTAPAPALVPAPATTEPAAPALPEQGYVESALPSPDTAPSTPQQSATVDANATPSRTTIELPALPSGTTDTAPSTALNAQRQAELEALLARAERQIEANLLTTPANDNAFDSYRQMLAIDPGNAQALSGLQTIKQSYRNWAAGALRKGAVDRATDYLQRALRVAPNDAEVRAELNRLRDQTSSDR